MRKYIQIAIIASLLALTINTSLFGQFMSSGGSNDPGFKATVDKPAYTSSHPRVLIDEAHGNVDVSKKLYWGFTELITNDGYAVSANHESFSKKTLEGNDVLIIVNAGAGNIFDKPDATAFTEAECDAVADWVRAGGSLLLIAGGFPNGKAAESLARRFDVAMSNGSVGDSGHPAPNSPSSAFLFNQENGLLADHPITDGRGSAEQVDQVLAYGGQSLTGPKGSVTFLKLADTAKEATGFKVTNNDGAISIKNTGSVSAAGRAEGLAFTFGSGRVVVYANEELFVARLVSGQAARMQGRESLPIGMNASEGDNRQLALNTLHWLSGALPAETTAAAASARRNSANSHMKPQPASASTQPKVAAPVFSATSIDGQKFDLAALKGKVVVLNFWFVACAPCVKEIPDLNSLASDYKDKNVVFLSLALDDEKPLRVFLKSRDFKYNLIPSAQTIIMQKYEVNAFPTHIVIGPDGKIIKEFVSGESFDAIRKAIDTGLGM